MSPKEVDLERADGFVRQLLYAEDELAVVDVSSDVLTVNWTTHQSAAQFVDFATHLPGFETAGAVVCSANDELDTDMEGLVRLRKDSTHADTEAWNIVRLDVSDTRSVAWERLPGGMMVVGFGDDTGCMRDGTGSEAVWQLDHLLRSTRSPHIESEYVVENAVKLSLNWLERGLPTAGDPEPRTATDEEWRWP